MHTGKIIHAMYTDAKHKVKSKKLDFEFTLHRKCFAFCNLFINLYICDARARVCVRAYLRTCVRACVCSVDCPDAATSATVHLGVLLPVMVQ